MKRADRSRLTRSAAVRLVALLNGVRIGQVYQMANRRLAFRYDDAWRFAAGAYPLSLSMPLAAEEHGDRAIRNYMWGLLSEDPSVLASWARRHDVARTDVIGLLSHVGEDCAGAVQFVRPDRAARLEREGSDGVVAISRDEVGQRLRTVALDHSVVRADGDTGQFSLAGAQPKIALLQNAGGEWGVPSGRTPTNRILKPPTLRLDDIAYVEHACLLLARQLGLAAAASTVQSFGGEIAIVLERYDRIEREGEWLRIHQEDVTQALALPPSRKYESDGGPGAAQIIALFRDASSEPDADVARFVDALAFNWLIAGTDAHAKNYSMLHGIGPVVRLAPLYDLISFLPYRGFFQREATMAMTIGGEGRVDVVGRAHWEKLCRDAALDADTVLTRVKEIARKLPEAAELLAGSVGIDEKTRQVMGSLGALISGHCAACARRM
jgi:serine/threonine-protein kinase HipA